MALRIEAIGDRRGRRPRGRRLGRAGALGRWSRRRCVIPDGLAPLVGDHERDTGTYVEPGIWVRHR